MSNIFCMKTDKTLFWITTIFGILVTALIIFAIIMEITTSILFGFNSTIRFHLQNSPLYFLIYLAGYAVAWRRPLKGSIIILTISILGYIFGFGEERMAYVFTFFVGFLYLAYWIDGRSIKKR